MQDYFVGMSTGSGLHDSAFWLYVVLCSVLYLLQRDVSFREKKTDLICGYKDKWLYFVSVFVSLVV